MWMRFEHIMGECEMIKEQHDTGAKIHPLLVGNLNLALVDGVDDVVRGLAVNGAANRLGSAENLLRDTRKLLRQRLGAHCPCNLPDLVERDVAGVLDVLLLLAVTRGLYRHDQYNIT